MNIAILSGTVYGAAEEVARHAKTRLETDGFTVRHFLRGSLEDIGAFKPDGILAVTSTTGLGELPDDIQRLYHALRDSLPAYLRSLPGAVIALGDSAYGDTFCAGGEQLRELYAELGVREVVEMLRLDASETVTPEDDAEPWLRRFSDALDGLRR